MAGRHWTARPPLVRLVVVGFWLGWLAAFAAASAAVGPAEQDKGRAAKAERAKEKDPEEAPTGFNNSTNGFEDQDTFDKDREKFEEVETILPDKAKKANGGLGPVYNATSCVSCHQNPVTGSSSQVAEIRAGTRVTDTTQPAGFKFVEPKGGSLIHQRAIAAEIQEHVLPEFNVRTLRTSTNILGDGFVEVIPDGDLVDVQNHQPDGLKGLLVPVRVVVKGTKTGAGDDFKFDFAERFGRFGWKCQEASLVNFAAGAYLNEMGITSPLQPKENLSNGRDVTQFDAVQDPEDEVDPKDPDNKAHPDHPFGDDVKAFARFMRSTKAPPRDFAATDPLRGEFADVQKGEDIFRNNKSVGCAVCHHPDYTTPPSGTPIGSATDVRSDLGTVPPALGGKVIHPYSDFMLHDIGTGDGIAQTQHAQDPPRGAENARPLPENLRSRPRVARQVREKVHPDDRRARVIREEGELDQRTVNKIRTAPLWGLRVRPQLLHDGSALTAEEAIRKHKVKSADGTVDLPGNYDKLSDEDRRRLLAFLGSL